MPINWLAVKASLFNAAVLAVDSETLPVAPTAPAPRPVAWGAMAAYPDGRERMLCLAGGGDTALARFEGGPWTAIAVPPHTFLAGAPQSGEVPGQRCAGQRLATVCLGAVASTRPMYGWRILYDLGCAVAGGWLPEDLVSRALAGGGVACLRTAAAEDMKMENAHLAGLSTHGYFAMAAGYDKTTRRARSRCLSMEAVAHSLGVARSTPKGVYGRDSWTLRWGELAGVPAPQWPAEAIEYLAEDVGQTAALAGMPIQLPTYTVGLDHWGMYLWETFLDRLGTPCTPRTFSSNKGDILVDVLHGRRVVVRADEGISFREVDYYVPGGMLAAEARAGLRGYLGA